MIREMFQPTHVKEANAMAQNARKLLHRKRDLMSDAQYADYSAQIGELEAAARNGRASDRKHMEEIVTRLDKSFGKLHPVQSDAGWRENCEVLLVAFILAIGIRAYFLQPFKIPTASMSPTLNGIVTHEFAAGQSAPGAVRKLGEYLWLGRTYADAVSTQADEIVGVSAVKHFLLLNYSRITCQSGLYYDVYVPKENLEAEPFDVKAGRHLSAGETIVRGYVDTGDQVFVDKFTYNFRLPQRGDVFVFSTLGIRKTYRADMDPRIKSEFYIKRLGGLPGDQLRIDQPRLYINGALAQGFGFERVMKAQGMYGGYTNPSRLNGFDNLCTPDEPYTVPRKNYFALGDNSAHSWDSRGWGPVPAENVVGRGLFVYYPFTSHWGPIR